MGSVAIISASVGAGHDGVARELVRRLTARGVPVSCVDFLDLLPDGLGHRFRAAYAWELAHVSKTWGWVLGATQLPVIGRATAALAVRAGARGTLASIGPDVSVVVSTYPLASQVLGAARADGRLTVPVLTYLTDMSVHRLWVGHGVDLHLALHPLPARQARQLGGRTCLVAPAIGPGFRSRPDLADRLDTRLRHGLPLDRPIALVVGGSWGVGDLAATMTDIARSGVAVPVALCGNNLGLRDRLRRLGFGPALGWTDDMPALLRASDVVIQNAGGLTSLQALASGVPVLSYRCVPGHGVTNAEALAEAGYAPWIRRRADLSAALRATLAGPTPRLPVAPDPAAVIAEFAQPAPAPAARPTAPVRRPVVREVVRA